MPDFPLIVIKQLPRVTITGGLDNVTSNADLYGMAILLSAPNTNAGTIYVGDASVLTTSGCPLVAGERLTFGADLENGYNSNFPLDSVYCRGTSAGDFLYISYLDRG